MRFAGVARPRPIPGAGRRHGAASAPVPTGTRGAAIQVHTGGPDDLDVHEATRRQLIGDLHEPVDLRRLPVAARPPRPVHQHGRRAADEVAPASLGDLVADLAQLGHALGDQRLRHPPVQTLRVGSLLLRIGEDADPVQLRLGHEGQQLVVVLLGLAGVTHDEVGAEGGVRAPPGGSRRREPRSARRHPSAACGAAAGGRRAAATGRSTPRPVARIAATSSSVRSDG